MLLPVRLFILMIDSIMSDYDRAVDEITRKCKSAKKEEHKALVLKTSKKRRHKYQVRQTNMELNHLYNGIPMKGYGEMKFRTPARSGLNDEELNFMGWFEPEDRDDVISLPDTVVEEFARFTPNIHRLHQQLSAGTITEDEFIAGRQALTASLEEARYYRDREGGGTELLFEPRTADTERPADTNPRPMGRIVENPIGEFIYDDVPEPPVY